jgi:hypothetical protein
MEEINNLQKEKIRLQAIVHYWQQLQRLDGENFDYYDKKIDEWCIKRDSINSEIEKIK